jgi:hypothetical protein
MSDDLRELLRSLISHEVEFLVVGAHAVAYYARPRYTEDLDLLVSRNVENVNRLKKALDEFGAGIGDSGAAKLTGLDRAMIRLGTPPSMVDIINFGSKRPFADLWLNRVEGELDEVKVCFPSKEDLIEMKLEAGRPQDLVDVTSLKKSKKK